MKRTTYIVVLLLVAQILLGQSPLAINYQGVALNDDGMAISDMAVNLQITILEGSSTGNPVYTERHQVNTDAIGHYMVAIGRGDIQQGAFSDIVWGQSGYWTKIDIDRENNNDFRQLALIEFLSVPYANYARTATSGIAGPRGPKGPDGPKGPTGPTSAPSPACPPGAAGEPGDPGQPGAKGMQGPNGLNGFPIVIAQPELPVDPAEGTFYMDDGTNRADGVVGMRYFDGSVWIDL